MSKTIHYGAWPILLFALSTAQATTIEVCPQFLQTTQTVDVPDGWQLFKSGHSSRLNSVQIFDASPATQNVGMKSDTSEPIENGRRSRWNLAGRKDAWIVCRYSGSVDGIARPLGPLTSCEVTFMNGGPDPVRVSCTR